MDINKFFQSKWFKGIVIGTAALIIFLFIFKAGMIVGIKKANFSCHWSENYHQNFGGPRGGFLGGFGDRDFIDANGVFGQIIKINDSSLVIMDRDNVEKVVLVNDSTVINSLRETIKLSDLKIDDYIVVIGEPDNSGQITAKLIRVMPSRPEKMPFRR